MRFPRGNGMYSWLASTHIVQRLAAAALRTQGRLRVAELDASSAERCQLLALQKLVHRGRKTRFGQDHDFGRIGDLKDFQRLVPLGTPRTHWDQYWLAAVPHLQAATWCEANTQLALIGNAPGALMHVPVSPSLCRAYWKAAATALAVAAAAQPSAAILPGKILFLGPSAQLSALPGDRTNQLDATILSGAPALLAPYVCSLGGRFGDPASAGAADEKASDVLPLRVLYEPLSCIVADRERLKRLLTIARRHTGKTLLRDLWPGLSIAVLTGRSSTVARESIDMDWDGVAVLQACLPLEAPLAVEDPRHQCLRLLADVDVFHEFVPAAELQRPSPTRHTLKEVVPGESYAVAFTTPAGLWACLSDLHVTFEKRDPWLIREVSAKPAAAPVGTVEPKPLIPWPLPPAMLHPRSGGTAARRRGGPSRTTSSARARN